jgi:hypothetical protein
MNLDHAYFILPMEEDMNDETIQPIEAPEWEWAFIEIMGHRSHWGRCIEVEKFGAKMIRVDVPISGDPAKGWTTHLYGGPSIFSYSLTDEATVMKRNKPYEPPSRLQLENQIYDETEF